MRWWFPFLFLLICATAVAMVARPVKEEREIALSATFLHLAEDLLRVDTRPHAITLLVSGAPGVLDEIHPGEIACRIDLSGLAAGIHRVAIDPAAIDLPKGIRLKTLLTPSLTVTLARTNQKTVDVVATLTGRPAPGFTVADVSIRPARIVIKGTAAMVDDMETVTTRPIDLAAASDTFRKEVPLNLPEAIVVDPPLGIVVVQIRVTERIVTRVLENIPVMGKGQSTTHRIEPADITLTVRGPELIVDAIKSNPDFSVTIDLTDLPEGSHMLSATIQLPVRTTLMDVRPDHFSVTIEK